MSRVDTADSEVLRKRLDYALRGKVAHAGGSLYLVALACCYLSAPEGAEPTLCHEFDEQAKAERVDPDELLNALIMAVPK